ncbi:MAG: acyl-CoA ligase (AMP-forming), exosortase A system-associated [Sphingobium sp.]
MGRADHPALAGKSGALSYAELEQAVGRLAAWLAAQDLPPGSRVATWAAKGRLACLMPLAAPRAGLVHVPVNPLLKHAQVAHILADCGARLLIATPARLATLPMDDMPDGCAQAGEGDALAAAQALPQLPPSDAAPDDLAALLYTSGSTGRPKGVMLSHANLWLGAVAVADYLRLTPEDRILAVLPFSFDYGQNQLFSTWAAGGTVVPLDYLTARDVIKAVEREGITGLAGVPPLWVQLVEADWPPETAARLRRLTNSGGALTRPLVARLRALFPDADLYPMYGLTEAFRSTYLPPELVASHPDSMGRAIPHAEILVCRPDGALCGDGEPGELVHCGPLVAQGYWNDPARTAERFRPAPPASYYGGMAVWSGDTVRRDADRLLYFVGRADAMIKSAGNRISPTEIEEAAQSVPGVAEAVALGVSDPRLGQAILLLVRAAEGDAASLEEAIRGRFRAELPNYMMPGEIRMIDQFPRNPNGKIDRVALSRQYAATGQEADA